jgi:hypothetical protein
LFSNHLNACMHASLQKKAAYSNIKAEVYSWVKPRLG